MLFKCEKHTIVSIFIALLFLGSAECRAQGALLMEEPYGVFGTLNPTGHNAIYLQRVCAETPVKLRRCLPGESGAVIARYQGIRDYDWVAIPLVPYLYSVENTADVPEYVDRAMVARMRDRYREAHLQALGDRLPTGGFTHGGWTQLVGVAYERRIYAFRFATTPEQDDALIARMNAGPNRSHFNLLFNNCADFARVILSNYFPHTFGRSLFPDGGVTTPKQISHKLVRYARKNPQVQLAVFQIPQVPGYRRQSHSNKGIAESLITTGYVVPIVLLNPYLAGGLFADYLMRSRYHLIPSDSQVLGPDDLSALTEPAPALQNPSSAGVQAPSAAASASQDSPRTEPANSGLKEITGLHE